MRILQTVVAAAVLGLAVAAGVALTFVGRGGLAADRSPGRIEGAIAQRLVRLSLSSTAATPIQLSEDGWRHGRDHFAEHCAMCHGGDGRGTKLGATMYPPVPDLSSREMQAFSDGELFAIIQHGVSWTGMPAFRSTHSDADTWQLVAFIRRMPTLSAADVEPHREKVHEHASAATVVMDGTQFQPAEITVSAGQTITWTNKDPFPHNVVSAAGGFQSDELAPDGAWRWQTAARGTFRYVCTLHPGMTGIVHVK